MPQIVYYVAASVDGFIATSDGGIDWLAPFESSGEDYGYAAFYRSVDAVILGSRTYEQARAFGEWPYQDKPVLVASSRSLSVVTPNVVITRSDPAGLARELEILGAGRAWLVGGGSLAGSFAAASLIDEYIISTVPVLLGTGVRLLAEDLPVTRLSLEDSSVYPDGVFQSMYRPAG